MFAVSPVLRNAPELVWVRFTVNEPDVRAVPSAFCRWMIMRSDVVPVVSDCGAVVNTIFGVEATTSLTVTVISSAVVAGPSDTCTLNRYVPGPCAAVGVHENAPLDPLIDAPDGTVHELTPAQF